MSVPKARPVRMGESTPVEIELAQLRAQVRALADLLIECGIVDASMVDGRLHSAASRVAAHTPRRAVVAPPKKLGFWARLFARKPPPRGTATSMVGAIPTARMNDHTIPVVELPFDASVLYGEPDLNTEKRRNLTPTDMGKCERCWRVRPLAASRLCFRCNPR